MDKRDIQQRYDTIAGSYDCAEGIMEYLGARRLRRRLLSQVTGRVLEIAVGTGLNLPRYPNGVELTAIDLSPGMLGRARKRADRMAMSVDFSIMDGEQLGFPDNHFDTVVDSLTLCTFVDPVVALKEMARVLKPGGRILLFEHGRSDRPWLGRFQDRRVIRHAAQLGCHWNREPLEMVAQAGLQVKQSSRHFIGVFHLIEAVVI